MAKRKRATTADAVQILYRRYYEGRPERVRALEETRANDNVARTARPSRPIRSTANLAREIRSGPIRRTISMGGGGGLKGGNEGGLRGRRRSWTW
jgi:hypothetical protein